MDISMTNKKKLVVLTGPTAVGKTSLSITLAKAIGGEIISADSMQVYQKMNIGSAKITPEEMEDVPHYLIDILDPKQEFNVTLFQKEAKKAMDLIYQKGKIPIIVGGTGFYIQSVLYDIDFTKTETDSSIREELEQLASEKGAHYLHERLHTVDPESAKSIHENNVKRVIRALEYFEQTGEKISTHNEIEREKKSPYDVSYFVLTDDRENLYARINQRVDLMIEHGLVEEVQMLLAYGCDRNSVSMQGLGYKEIIDYLNGELTLFDAIELIKRDTRHFAKRQLTWFRREQDVIFLDKQEYNHREDLILNAMIKQIHKELS